MQMGASPVVTSCVRCNTVHQFLGSEEQARSAGYYVVKYLGKDPVKVKIILPVLYKINMDRESKAQDVGSIERDSQFWLTQALNNFNSLCEFADTQVASKLMGTDSYLTSHIFWTFHAKSFVNHQRENFGGGEMEPVAPAISDDHIHRPLPQDGTGDDEDRDAPRVFVTKDRKLRTGTQCEDYVRRGSELKHLPPYEWAATIRIEKKPKKGDKVSSTRQRNATFEFEDDGTGWHETHRQVLRSKFVVLHRGALQHQSASVSAYQSEPSPSRRSV